MYAVNFKMKVAMVTPFYSPVIGGSESFIENMSYKLTQKGLKVDVITFNFRNSKAPEKDLNQPF